MTRGTGHILEASSCLHPPLPLCHQMACDPYADRLFPDLLPHSATPSVKSEPSSSPHSDSPPTFSFAYPLHNPPPPLAYHPGHDRPVFRFGMPHPSDAWSLKRAQHDPASIALDLSAIPFHDDYEDGDELSDLPPTSGPTSHAGHSERVVRRRSSKGRFHPPPLNAAPETPSPSVRPVQEKQVQVRASCGW